MRSSSTAGETDYLSAKLEPESLASAGASAPAVYTVSIPADNFSADGVEYYIGARDPEGSRRWEYDGSGETPHKVTIGETGSIRLFIKPENARKAGARWRPKPARPAPAGGRRVPGSGSGPALSPGVSNRASWKSSSRPSA